MECETRLVYKGSSQTARATWRSPVSKNTKQASKQSELIVKSFCQETKVHHFYFYIPRSKGLYPSWISTRLQFNWFEPRKLAVTQMQVQVARFTWCEMWVMMHTRRLHLETAARPLGRGARSGFSEYQLIWILHSQAHRITAYPGLSTPAQKPSVSLLQP